MGLISCRPAERIATFDNDGTLWAEQPMYFQLLFALDRVKALAPQHPEWKQKEPFASLLKGDVKGALAGGEPTDFKIVMATHAGMTTEEFQKLVSEWITTAKHPKTKRPYTEMVYQPMVEVLAYLRANGFKTFIVSGGGVEFMRPWVEKAYGIPPEQVVGSSGKLRFDLRDGKPTLMKLPELNFFDDKAGKTRRHTNLHRAPPDRRLRQFGWRLADAPVDLRGFRRAPLCCLCITPTPHGNGPTIASRTSASSTRDSTKPRSKAGPLWTWYRIGTKCSHPSSGTAYIVA